MFLIFYCMKYPAAQHLEVTEGHQEFTEELLDLRLAHAKFCC